jgi:O-antigen/teichoic acid export membrane protein
MLVLSILLYLFNKKEFSLFVNSEISEVSNDDKMISYGKKMFYNSIVLFISGWVLSFIVSIQLPLSETGAYNILSTIAGLSVFLLINLNKVFAPAISKLYHKENFKELDLLYKKTTLLVNFFSIPLLILIAAFSNNILSLYGVKMLDYEKYLYFLLIGSMISISAGSSGIFMIMAGLEKKELMLQSIKVILITILGLFLIPRYGMIAVVLLFVFSSLMINISQLIFIKRELGISPFSYDLLKLIFISYICMYVAITHENDFNIFHFVIIPFLVYLFFYLLMFKSISSLVKELK